MCYATAYWAGIRTVFYAAAWSDYSDLFSDQAINEDMQHPKDKRESSSRNFFRVRPVRSGKNSVCSLMGHVTKRYGSVD